MDNKINFVNYKLFQNNNNNINYIFCVLDNKIFEIDDRILILLKQKGKTYIEIKNELSALFSENEFDELMCSIREVGLIEDTKDYSSYNYNLSTGTVSSLVLLIAQECNLRCTYCYAEGGKYNNSGKMDIITAKKAIDFLNAKNASGKSTICFFGGEPLLNFELIKMVVDYCHMKEVETGRKFGFTMTTNGTLINDEIENFIIKHNIKTQISIDGDEKTHNANRSFGNQGSYATVISKTKSLREKEILDARATVTMKEHDLLYLYNYLNSINFNNVVLAPALNLLKDDEYEVLADSYIKLFRICEKSIKQKKYKEVKQNKMFMNQIAQIHSANVRYKACGAGSNIYAIDINGDIYPCQRFVGHYDMKLGNVFQSDEGRDDFLKKTTISNFEKCVACWIRNLCVGGCVYENYELTGNINSPYDPYCNYKIKIIEELINIYIRLDDGEIHEFFSE